MTTTLEKSSDRLLHVRVANRLLDHLRKENLEPETRIKALRELAQDYEVSYQTIQKSVQLLKTRGVLDIRKGDGIYLVQSLDSEKKTPTEPPAEDSGNTAKKRQRQTDHVIAVVTPVWASDELPEHFGQPAIHRLLAGFLAECDQYHWGIEMIYNAPPDEAARPEFVDKILRRGVDGVLWLRPDVGHRMNMMRLIDRGLFVVGCGRQFPEIPTRNVSEDHAKIATACLQWLKARGKTQIGMLTAVAEGRQADPFAVELNAIFAHAAEQEGLSLPASAICQAFRLPTAIREDVLRLFFQRNRHINGIICAYNPLLSVLEQLALRDELPQVNDLICVDLMSDYRPVVPSAGSHLHAVGVQNPLEDIGRHLASEFIGRWLASPAGISALPEPRIVDPTPSPPDFSPAHD
ncbi:transcriptional regulator [Opitutaceae bacterium TAV1]|nr:transcriptional regulator [Opitutaceae bacterium TAV1]